MGAYNILNISIECENCKKMHLMRIQFKFGDTWLHNYYKVGDKIIWGGNDVGKPNLKDVKVYGIAETSICPYCHYSNIDEYDIIIRNDVIEEIKCLDNAFDYLKLENYFILE